MDKVEVLEESDREVHAVSLSIKVPSVVRLMGFVRFRRKEARYSRKNVYARDKYRCQYCGEQHPQDELTCDHVIPRSRGGRTEWENIVTCCVSCNRRKGGRTPSEAGLKLVRTPARPSWIWGFQVRFTGKRPPSSWLVYLGLYVEESTLKDRAGVPLGAG
jgi:5-methylcytosine-specific restriction endonuclease McrA